MGLPTMASTTGVDDPMGSMDATAAKREASPTLSNGATNRLNQLKQQNDTMLVFVPSALSLHTVHRTFLAFGCPNP